MGAGRGDAFKRRAGAPAAPRCAAACRQSPARRPPRHPSSPLPTHPNPRLASSYTFLHEEVVAPLRPFKCGRRGGGGGPGSGAVAVRHAFQPPPCPQTCGPQTLPTLVPTPITPTPTLPIPPPPPTTRALPALCALQPRQKPAHVPRHDEFERFLPAAFPYYASAAAAMVAWYGAGLAALYSA